MKTSIISEGLITKVKDYLADLKKELIAYDKEEDIWLTPDGINNSTGTLTLHLIGNLNHFIGAVLGNTGYIRERKKEFSDRDIPITTLIRDLDEVEQVVIDALMKTTDDLYTEPYPFVFKKDSFKPTTIAWMWQIMAHLAYHVGQVNYHRRLLTSA